MKALLVAALLGVGGFAKAQVVVQHKNNYAGMPIEAMKQALAAKQAAYDKSIDECKNQVAELYNNAGSYPEIRDGKHLVSFVGGSNCRELYVIVDKGRVFSIDNGGNYITNLTLSTPIKDAHSKVGIPNPETGVSQYFDIIFLVVVKM